LPLEKLLYAITTVYLASFHANYINFRNAEIFIFDFSIKKILKENEDSLTLFWNIHFYEMEYSKLIETSAEAAPVLQ
jgi:hypothetical protein